MLNERKQKLLSAIVQSYVDTVSPIGSRTICKLYNFDLSPATIRNEMAEMEEDGLLLQPHTSAGRIPSDTGYRIYVNQLMEKYIPKPEEQAFLSRSDQTANALDAILSQAARILAELSKSTVVVQAPHLRQEPIKYFHMLPIDRYSVVLTIDYGNGLDRKAVIRLSQALYPETVTLLTNYLNAKLQNTYIDELFHATVTLPLEREVEYYKSVLLDLIGELYSQIQREEKVYLSGTSNLLREPEFRETEIAYPIFQLLEKESRLQQLLHRLIFENNMSEEDVLFVIGHENVYPELHPCSLVSTKYHIGQKVGGTIGVIGPTRMHYSRTVTMLEAVAKSLTHTLTNFFA